MRKLIPHDLGHYEVVVVGAGNAGASAALVLGRARRRVLVLDQGAERSDRAAHTHRRVALAGGVPPEALRLGREQLRPYPVNVQADEVRQAHWDGAGFALTLASGATARANALVLATGVTNELPPVPGLAEQWGRGVYDCPYCHGWESRHSKVLVYGQGEAGYQQAVLLQQWCSPLTLCTDGPPHLTPAQQAHLAALGISVVATPVKALRSVTKCLLSIDFIDGCRLPLDVLFVRPVQRQRSNLAAQLGCAFAADGVSVLVNESGQTNVPNVYAVGEMTGPDQQAIVAAASGTRAGTALNNAFIFSNAVAV